MTNLRLSRQTRFASSEAVIPVEQARCNIDSRVHVYLCMYIYIYTLSKILKVCFHMLLSYARGSWRFKVASLVASSVAVAVRHGNVGGSFSGNEELVASLMAECDGKNEGKRIWVAKGVATLHGKN